MAYSKKSAPSVSRRRVTTLTPRNFNIASDELNYIDYKNVRLLRRYMTRYMKIEPRRRSGLSAKQQRDMATAIKRSRYMALVPYTLH
jgi:small subunit ribosomal protein S18